jgi:hypothetical protein
MRAKRNLINMDNKNWDDDWHADAESLQELEAELPVLNILRNFADEMANAQWFSELGETLDPQTRALARLYIDGLGMPDADLAQLPDWDDVVDVAQTMDLNSEAWEVEEQLRAAVSEAALHLVTPEGLQVVLTYLSAALAVPLRNAAEEALSLSDENADTLLELMVGAGQQAAFGALLALAAGQADMDGDEPDIEEISRHPLFVKYRLFAIGRWPVSLTGRSFNLF